MVGFFFQNIVRNLTQNKWKLLLVLALLIPFIFIGISKLRLDDDMFSIFPQGNEFKKYNEILEKSAWNRQVIFSIENKFEFQEDGVDSMLQSVEQIKGIVGDDLTNIKAVREDIEADLIQYHQLNAPFYLEKEDYDRIEKKITKDSIQIALTSLKEQLSSSSGLFTGRFLLQDPLGIARKHLTQLANKNESSNFEIEDGVLFSKDKKNIFFTADLNFPFQDSKRIEELRSKLDKIVAKSSVGLDYFGTFLIADENAKQVKKDTYLTLIISISAILALLFFYYRSVWIPFAFVLPAIFSGGIALALLGWFDLKIARISVATSAVLLGIVLDYSFHFVTHYAHSKSLLKSVKELSSPMLLGSFTTVAAFAALLFTDSIVLKNFGLIALLTLTSAVLFTLLLFPAILDLFKIRLKEVKPMKNKSLSKWKFRGVLLVVIGLTVFFLIKSFEVKFDSDLNNLNHYPVELQKKEDLYAGLNPSEEKKLFLFVEDADKQKAIEQNWGLNQTIADLKTKEVLSVSDYLLPNFLNSKAKDWEQFWSERKDAVMQTIHSEGQNIGFKKSAFNSFEKWISNDIPIESNEDLLKSLGVFKLIHSEGGVTSIGTSVILDKKEVENFKSSLREKHQVFIFDGAEMTSSLVEVVQSDFNFLLLISSLIVFLSLFMVYGRIELALFSMFPMLLSWIWILGISALFDIQFNFVNIIIVTFIFGLGDDFSIFITDGLIQKYGQGKNQLQSYKPAIILSGITTIIGTGVLYFAKHPAVSSIALISVVGILTILFVSLVLQPGVFAIFVSNRTKRKRSPITLLGLLYSIFLYTYFLTGCTLIHGFLFILLLLPISRLKKRKILNFVISRLAKSTLYLGFHIKKRVLNPEKLDFSKPSILVANHTSFLDILTVLMLNPKVLIMVKKWVYNSPFFGLFIRYSGYLFVEEGADSNLEMVQKRLEEGFSIVVFPEGTRADNGKMKRFHKGAFFLAKELSVPIQPILILGAEYVNKKNDIIIKSGSIIVQPLDRIFPTDEKYQQRFGLLTKTVQKEMREEMTKLREREYTPNYLKNRILYNFLYKNPVNEWYVRVKYRFEKENYAFYDTLIGRKAKIYDIGCGLGYMSYFLHYRSEEREIIGLDYDEEKIEYAQNGYDKSDNLNFIATDIRQFSFEKSDVIFFTDVLHYLQPQEQFSVLKNAVDSLNEGGILFIRDGITDLGGRHEVTQKTEKYSTRILRFNKTTNDLHFFSRQDIENFAKENKLSLETKQQSEKTSNVLFILRK